ncbi:RNA-binding protein [Cupriavidus taiwanensis]|uniref:RNA-binding protein n=1 Tax=Cupriavidus taiwanensis TaxID=164546 RepID=UPI00216112ED|nr:RNA-binding protein [Cupriavidus taiwanensis]
MEQDAHRAQLPRFRRQSGPTGLAPPGRRRFPEYQSIEHMEGDGTRPAVRLTVDTLDDVSLEKLKGRIHNMFWRSHKLSALVMRERFS